MDTRKAINKSTLKHINSVLEITHMISIFWVFFFFAVLNKVALNIFMCKAVLKHNPVGVTISVKRKKNTFLSVCL